jgi:preprotein translocase subunit SecG
MKIALIIIHIAVSIALIGLILIQSSKGGLGTAFGGGGEFRSRRGAEKIIFRATIITACIFLIISITNLLVR